MRRAALLFVGCCACFGGKAPHYDYFVLTPTATANARPRATPRASEQSTVAVSQVNIPRYLDRDAIVTRADDYRVIYSNQERWAEPLDEALARTLRQDLAATLAPAGISVPSRTGAPTYDLQIDVLRFERRGPDRVELWARWTLRTEGESPQTHETRLQVPIENPSSSAAAAALSQAVARLATEIAAQVRIAERTRDREPLRGQILRDKNPTCARPRPPVTQLLVGRWSRHVTEERRIELDPVELNSV